MSKENLINTIMTQEGVTKKAAEDAIKMVTAGITQAMARGEEVSLVGFGKFEVKDVPARTGRNPQTGEQIQIPARRAVKFKAGQKLKSNLLPF